VPIFPASKPEDYDTINKVSYQPFEIKEKTKSAKIPDTYQKSNELMNEISVYKAEYIPFKKSERAVRKVQTST
jgi:hypothetical protein